LNVTSEVASDSPNKTPAAIFNSGASDFCSCSPSSLSRFSARALLLLAEIQIDHRSRTVQLIGERSRMCEILDLAERLDAERDAVT